MTQADARPGRTGKVCSPASPAVHSPWLRPLRRVDHRVCVGSTSRSTPSPSPCLAVEQLAAWKALETFAENGAWHEGQGWTYVPTQVIATAPGRIWHGFHVSAVDDTKVHRSGAEVWGTCTFHDVHRPLPQRASTVRAHNWVVLAPCSTSPTSPGGSCRSAAGSTSASRSCRPAEGPSGVPDQVRAGRRAAPRAGPIAPGHKHLGVFDGGYVLESVVRPLVLPEGGAPRVDVLTRLRCATPGCTPCRRRNRPAGRPGPKPKWGRRLPPPRRGGFWERGWRTGSAFIYGRERKVRWKEEVCLWQVLGQERPVKAVVAQVEGYKKRFTLVTSAAELTGLQMVELFAARFRQEDGFRDLKQRLGWEECRAWTKNPIERTSQRSG